MYGSDVSVAVKVAEVVQRGTEAGGALLFTPTPYPLFYLLRPLIRFLDIASPDSLQHAGNAFFVRRRDEQMNMISH